MLKDIKKARGFTLVELLVVIVIISVLAGILVMSVTSIQEEAEFAKMVSDLKSMKAAARLYYADTGIMPGTETVPVSDTSKQFPAYPDSFWDTALRKYLDKPLNAKKYGKGDSSVVSFAYAWSGNTPPTWGAACQNANNPAIMNRSIIYIGFYMDRTNNGKPTIPIAVKRILAKNAKEVGLYGGDYKSIANNGTDYYTTNHRYIHLRLR